MSRRLRFVLTALVAFVICTGLVLLMAYGVGADPFHPRSRHIWLLSLLAAAYASVRLAMIAERVLHWTEAGKDGRPRLRGFGFLGKKEHAIDRRMAERKARLEAAEQRAKQQELNDKEADDE